MCNHPNMGAQRLILVIVLSHGRKNDLTAVAERYNHAARATVLILSAEAHESGVESEDADARIAVCTMLMFKLNSPDASLVLWHALCCPQSQRLRRTNPTQNSKTLRHEFPSVQDYVQTQQSRCQLSLMACLVLFSSSRLRNTNPMPNPKTLMHEPLSVQ